MKFGVRKPNLKKSVKARTTGKIIRKVKSSVNPLYGKKGMGVVNNPKKAVYNKVYTRTTVGVNPLSRQSTKKSSSSRSTRRQPASIGYTKKEHIEKEVIVTNPIERWLRKLFGKKSTDKKIIQETVITEQYTHEQMEEIKAEAEESLSRFKQSLRHATDTVNVGVFFSNLTEAEQALSKAAYFIRCYSFLASENNDIIETYHQFLDEKEAIIKQFLHRHFQSSVEGASELKTERGRRNRLAANYSDLTEQFSHLPDDTVDTINNIWANVIPQNTLKET